MTDMDCDKSCPICGGLGFVWNDVPITDPKFGKAEVCPNRRNKIWFNKLGITEEEAGSLDWNKYAVRPSSTQIKRALSLLFTRGYGFLYLWGTPGTGKTALSKSATVLARYKYGLDALYCTHSDMTNALRTSYDAEDGQSAYKRTLDRYCNVHWLVIDEIGRDRRNDFSKAVLSDVLNARYNASIERKRAVTILISNFDPAEVLDDYQLDRVHDRRSVILQVKDVSFRALPMFDEERKADPTWWQNL